MATYASTVLSKSPVGYWHLGEASYPALITDSFTRADNPLALGSADTGQAWTALNGTWGILANQAYPPGATGSETYAVIDTGVADGAIGVTLAVAATATFTGICFRALDVNNVLYAFNNGTSWSIRKLVAGVETALTSGGGAAANGDVMRVTMHGSTLRLYVNGVLICSASDAFNRTITKHGLLAASAAARFTNFSVRPSLVAADSAGAGGPVAAAIYAEGVANLVRNPSFETDLSGWATVPAFTSRDITTSVVGAASAVFTAPAIAGELSTTGGVSGIKATGSIPYTLSLYAKDTLSVGATWRGSISQYDSGGTLIQSDVYNAGNTRGIAAWTRFNAAFTTLANCAYLQVRLIVEGSGIASNVGSVWWDGIQLEQAAAASAYCDGDQSGCYWLGTARGAVSVRLATLNQPGAIVAGADGAVSLDGSSAKVVITDSTTLHVGSNFTVELWFKRGRIGVDEGLINGGPNSYSIYITGSDNKIHLDKANVVGLYVSTFAVIDTNWHYIAWSQNGTAGTLRFDAATYTFTAAQTLVDSLVDQVIGANVYSTLVTRLPFLGIIDEVAIYNRALSTSETMENYVAGITPQTQPPFCFSGFQSGERLIYLKPSGDKYLLHAPPSRAVLSEEGFGVPPLAYVTDRGPFQHGDTPRTVFLQPRPVQLVVIQNFRNRQDYWQGRADLIDAVRPNRVLGFDAAAPVSSAKQAGSLLYYLANGKKRQLDVLLDSGPGFAPPQGGWREWSFTEVLRFTAHDPVWYDPSVHTITFPPPTAATFPAVFPLTFTPYSADIAVPYDGTWIEYPTFVANGPFSGIRIEHLITGDKLILNADVPAGMSVTIVLRGNKSITRSDGLNLFSALSSDSNFTTFGLSPDPQVAGGTNTLRVTAISAASTTLVTMTWYSRYLGI